MQPNRYTATSTSAFCNNRGNLSKNNELPQAFSALASNSGMPSGYSLCLPAKKENNYQHGQHSNATGANFKPQTLTTFENNKDLSMDVLQRKHLMQSGSGVQNQNSLENQNCKRTRFGFDTKIETGTESAQIKPDGNKQLTEGDKKPAAQSIRIFTGTADRVIRWNRIYKEFYYIEVIASVIGIQEGNVRLQKIMLLRDKKGPILQVVHYVSDHINIDEFHVGQMLRCVGHMVGPNILHAFSIRAATADEVANLQRLCYICDHAVARAVASTS